MRCEHRTLNAERKCKLIRRWAFDVGCWMLDVGCCAITNDHQNQKLSQRSKSRAAEMFVAVGPKGKRVPPLQGTERLDCCRCHLDGTAGWLRRVLRFWSG